jgi:signal peptidase I
MMRAAEALAIVLLGLAASLCAAVAFGALTIVTTEGVSMHPTYFAGDLVLVAPASSYSVGEIIAYRDHVHDLTVLHRIVATDPSGYRLTGDNTASVDAVHPTSSDDIGRSVLHIPRAGRWLHRLLSPLPLTVLAIALTFGGSTRIRSRRRRPRVSRHAAPNGSAVMELPANGRRIAAGAASAGLLGLTLAALTWTTSVGTHPSGVRPPVGSLSFSYHANVGRTAAYDDRTVRSPDPVFRRLATAVSVNVSYRGKAGRIAIEAQLSTASGWHSAFPLAAARPVTDGRYQSSVQLVLPELEQRARAAAAVTGIAAGEVAVSITAVMTDTHGRTFAPSLKLTLTPLALLLVDPTSLTATQPAGAGDRAETIPATRRLLGHDVPIEAGRVASAVLVLGSLLAGLVLLVMARRSAPTDESAAIQRRYASMLMSVHPLPSPSGQRVVEVSRFVALVTLAERYDLPVLHWTRSNTTTFIVHDRHTDYRYRTGTGGSAVPSHLTEAGAAT